MSHRGKSTLKFGEEHALSPALKPSWNVHIGPGHGDRGEQSQARRIRHEKTHRHAPEQSLKQALCGVMVAREPTQFSRAKAHRLPLPEEAVLEAMERVGEVADHERAQHASRESSARQQRVNVRRCDYRGNQTA
jgi:hypothetical protein